MGTRSQILIDGHGNPRPPVGTRTNPTAGPAQASSVRPLLGARHVAGHDRPARSHRRVSHADLAGQRRRDAGVPLQAIPHTGTLPPSISPHYGGCYLATAAPTAGDVHCLFRAPCPIGAGLRPRAGGHSPLSDQPAQQDAAVV